MPIVFIAGATGYTGRVLMQQFVDGKSTWQARPHARAQCSYADAVIADPLDVAALTEGMRGSDAVVQLIGITRKQFSSGMTYEKIDLGTTIALGEAAKAAGVPRLLLVSSMGAGRPMGHYLRVKRQTEQWVEQSGLDYTIFRPAAITGPGRQAAKLTGVFFGWSKDLRPIDVNDLATIIRHSVERPEAVHNQILQGKSLWQLLD